MRQKKNVLAAIHQMEGRSWLESEQGRGITFPSPWSIRRRRGKPERSG
jgi:hypothetical protein